MPLLLSCVGGMRYLGAISLLLWSLYAVAAAETGELELWFEYDGRPLTLTHMPQVQCLQQPGLQALPCALRRDSRGRYWLERPPVGRYLLRINADENRANGIGMAGDFARQYPLQIDATTTGPILISMQRLFALQQIPEALTAAGGVQGGCSSNARYDAELLALFPAARIELAWESLGAAGKYHYKLWRVRCSDGLPLEQVRFQQIGQSRVTLELPPSRPGEHYRFELIALNGGQTIGALRVNGGASGQDASAYRFVVADPLIDRRWLYYAIAALALLFLLWLIIGALRSAPAGRAPSPAPEQATPSGRLRPLVAMSLLLGLVIAGYSQRSQWWPWLEGQLPVALAWAEAEWSGEERPGPVPPAPEGVEQVKAPPGNRLEGEWKGVIVAATPRPFVGNERRAEIRLSVDGARAVVEWRQHGRWHALGAGDFRLQRLGSGVTLFGHRRSEGYSELWTLSIADIGETTPRLSLDRMVTHRDRQGHASGSVRHQARGEIRRRGS